MRYIDHYLANSCDDQSFLNCPFAFLSMNLTCVAMTVLTLGCMYGNVKQDLRVFEQCITTCYFLGSFIYYDAKF